MKHTPANPACHWIVTFVDGVERGVCKVCKAKRVFDSERTRVERLKKDALPVLRRQGKAVLSAVKQ